MSCEATPRSFRFWCWVRFLSLLWGWVKPPVLWVFHLDTNLTVYTFDAARRRDLVHVATWCDVHSWVILSFLRGDCRYPGERRCLGAV